MLFDVSTRKTSRNLIFLSDSLHPQTISVIKTRANSLGIRVVLGDVRNEDFSREKYAGILIQYPDTNGEIFDYTDIVSRAHQSGVIINI